jgi:hypothetical protein
MESEAYRWREGCTYPAERRCRCGGPLTLDKSHISEARRFACLATTRLLWKCLLCGHSLWLDQSTTPEDLNALVDEVEAKPVA